MLFKITRKEYNNLKIKYQEELNKNENLNIINDQLKEERNKLIRKVEEMEFREKIRENDISKLNNAISNELEEINRLNVELAELKNKPKRGRPRKVKESK